MPNNTLMDLSQQLLEQMNLGRVSTPAFGSSSMRDVVLACSDHLSEEVFHRMLDPNDYDVNGTIEYLIKTVEGQIDRVLEREGNQDIAEPIVKPGRDIVATLTEIRAVMRDLREEQLGSSPNSPPDSPRM